jgi:FSR family fosmidomycin resistance protein-like MFS transporter
MAFFGLRWVSIIHVSPVRTHHIAPLQPIVIFSITKGKKNMFRNSVKRHARRMTFFMFVLLVIEFIDEFVFGMEHAAMPLIRDDLGMNYDQIGLLFTIPNIIATFIEMAFGIWGNGEGRKWIIMGGGIGFTLACTVSALSQDFSMFLLSFIIFFPSSGAFVTLSQAILMDIDPTRHQQNMARWTFAGSLGVVGGSLIFGAWGNWRGMFALCALLSAGVSCVVIWHYLRGKAPQEAVTGNAEENQSFMDGLKDALAQLRRKEVLRWLTLLEFSDLMLDILLAYLALYFVDVVGKTEGEAAIAVAIWTSVGLLGDFLLIPLLERVNGLIYLRFSAALTAIIYPLFLIVPSLEIKLGLLATLGFFNSGWYSILQGEVYTTLPDHSAAAELTIGNIAGFVAGFIPLAIGMVAERAGLDVAMWLLLLGPIALLIGIPRQRRDIIATSDD